MHFDFVRNCGQVEMAALNWVMLAEKTREPLALPREKWLQSFGSVSLSLSPSLPGAPLHDKPQGDLRNERKAAGIAHISNLRIVFVADSAISPTSTISSTASSSTAVETLSLPYGALEGRFVQPIFHSNYFEALCLPASDGNLNDTPHTVRLAFKEAGAFEFYTLYEEMKSRQTSSRVAQAESLRTFVVAHSGSTSD